MPRPRKRTVRLNILLLKGGIRTASEVLGDRYGELEEFELQVDAATAATVHLNQVPVHAPKWRDFFAGQNSGFEGLQNATAGAVLLLDVAERTFAVTFGLAAHLVDPSLKEERFGLRVTLNACPASTIKRVDTTSLAAIGMQTRQQSSKSTPLHEFGLNPDEDLVRSLSGTPSDETLGTAMTGRDVLTASVDCSLAKLPALLERYLAKFEDAAYREAYGWIDHVAEVRAPEVNQRLDEALVERLKEPHPDKLWMAVPDVLEWEGVAGFRFGSSKARELNAELHINALKDSFRDLAAVTPDSLRQKHVHAIATEGDYAVKTWSAYGCLYSEQQDAQNTYVLTSGKWYQVATDYVQAVIDAVRPLAENPPIELPDYNHPSEGAYNLHVPSALPGVACLDKRLVIHGGGPSRVEVCDLMRADGLMIHVKKYGNAGALSHLFQQGIVAGDLWASDAQYRQKVANILPQSHRPADILVRPDPDRYPVVFAITSNRDKPITDSLPFFSRLGLKNAARVLGGFGYRVHVVRIRDTRPE